MPETEGKQRPPEIQYELERMLDWSSSPEAGHHDQ